MKKRVINIAELIVQIILLIFLFSAKSVAVISDPDFEWARDVWIDLGFYSFFDYAVTVKNYFALIVIGIMVITAIMCLVSIIRNTEDRDGVIHPVLAVVSLIFGAIYLTSIASPTGYEAVIGSRFQVFAIACLFVITVLSFVKRTTMIVPKKEKVQATVNNNTTVIEATSADELKKYKELLDSGVISQEEFDAKKKQLLGL